MLAALVVAAALLGPRLPVYAQREIVVDDSNTTAILYQPRASWNHWVASSETFAPGINSNDTLSVPLQTVTNATVTFNFTGIGFAYYGTTHPDTKTCNLTIDAQSHQLSLQSPDKATRYGQLIFSLQGLPDGHHTVVIQQVSGAKSSLFEIDRFVYTSRGGPATVEGAPTSPGQTTAAPTPSSDPSTSSSGSSGVNPGVIAGGVVSGLIVLAAALGIFWWLRRLDALDPKPKNSRPSSGLAAFSNHSNPSGFHSTRPVSYNHGNGTQDRSPSSLSKPTDSSRMNSPAPLSAASGPGLLPPLKSLSELNGQRDSPTPGPSSPRRAGKSSSTGGSFGGSHNRTGSTDRGGSSNGGPGSSTDRPESSSGSRSGNTPEPVAGSSKLPLTPEPVIVIPAAKVNRESTTSEIFEYPYEYAQYLLATPRSDAHRISAASSSSGRPLLPPSSPTSVSSSSRIASPPPGRVVSPPPQWQASSSNTNPQSVSPIPSSRTVRIASPLPLHPTPNTRVASPPLRNATTSPPFTKRSGTPPIRTATPITYPVVQSTSMTPASAAIPTPSPLPSRPRSSSQTLQHNMVAGGSNRMSRSNSLNGVGSVNRPTPSLVQDPNAPLSHSKAQHPFAYPDRSGSSPPSPMRENFAKQYGW